MKIQLLTLSVFLQFLGIFPVVQPAIVQYDFTIRYFTAFPDGVRKRVLSVNNQFPGPTIRAKLHDVLIVNVKNMIQTRESTSIHWHGIEQVLTPFEDGPEMVTQCPIPYGATHTYTFELKQSGTYWWHSHHAWQYIEGFWGILIVDNEPEVYEGLYDGEIIITLNDWYHKSGTEITDWYLSPASLGNEPIPDTLLLNGKGSYPCPNARARGFRCEPRRQVTPVFAVSKYRTYRIRVINTSALTPFFFSIDGHKLQTIEVDGVDTVRVAPVDEARISAAMRYSFLVKMDASSSTNTFWIRAKVPIAIFKPNPNINPYFPNEFEPEVKAILKYRPSSLNGTTFAADGQGPKSSDSNALRPGGEGPVLPQKPAGQSSQGATQGRPETHGINWNNLTQVTDLLLQEQINQALAASASVGLAEDRNQTKPDLLRRRKRQAQSPGNGGNVPIINQQDIAISQLNTVPAPTTQPSNAPVTLNPNLCRPFPGNRLAPAGYEELVTLNVEFATDSAGIKWGQINGIVYKIGVKPVIFQVLQGETIPTFVNPITSNLGKVVQVVINNRNPGGHPFHLHGHTFWVVGTGTANDGDYDEATDSSRLIRNGVRRDTTSVQPHSWAVIRYIADNPGVWLFHCHINWHLQAGLGAVFVEGEEIMRMIFRNIPGTAISTCRKARIDIT